MVAAVANGVLATATAFGIVPLGSGNDFAVHAGYPRHDALAACAVVASGRTRMVDVGRVAGGRAFLCVAGAGFDSESNEAANTIRWARGTAVYVAAVLKTLARFRPAGFTVRLDGAERSFAGMFVAVANARSYGGGMLIAPDASLDDGAFDVCLVGSMSKAALVGQFPRIFRGTHVRHPAVSIARAADVELSADRPLTLYADGEPVGPLPLRLTVEPRALTVIVP
jgi:diacylglycerol kinase (ATP)